MTKEDFLNASALVKKLSELYGTTYDLETVKKTMDSEFRKKTQIKTKFFLTSQYNPSTLDYILKAKKHP